MSTPSPPEQLASFILATSGRDGGGRTTVRALHGSLLEFRGDCIVNAANEGCVSGFGIDEAINRAAGEFEIKRARRALGGCPTGQAKVTPSFRHDLVRHIIHAVGPVYRFPFGMNDVKARGEWLESKDDLLVSAYKAALDRARELGATTIGFCLLSAGVFRGEKSLEQVIKIAIDTIAQEASPEVREVAIFAYTKDEADALLSVISTRFPAAE